MAGPAGQELCCTAGQGHGALAGWAVPWQQHSLCQQLCLSSTGHSGTSTPAQKQNLEMNIVWTFQEIGRGGLGLIDIITPSLCCIPSGSHCPHPFQREKCYGGIVFTNVHDAKPHWKQKLILKTNSKQSFSHHKTPLRSSRTFCYEPPETNCSSSPSVSAHHLEFLMQSIVFWFYRENSDQN